MNCEQATELAALAASGDVTPAEERALASHRASCSECRAEADAFEALCARLAAMREESAPDAVYASVRARVIGEIGERRVGWAILSPAFAVVVACTVILAIVLDSEKRIVTPTMHESTPIVADAGAPHIPDGAPVSVAHAPVPRMRHVVKPAKAQEAVAPPLVVHMFTDDPNVVIYWIADGRGSTAEKEIIQ